MTGYDQFKIYEGSGSQHLSSAYHLRTLELFMYPYSVNFPNWHTPNTVICKTRTYNLLTMDFGVPLEP